MEGKEKGRKRERKERRRKERKAKEGARITYDIIAL